MSFDLSRDPKRIQEIVTARRTVREELSNQIIELIKATPAGYGVSADRYRDIIVAKIRALVPEVEDEET